MNNEQELIRRAQRGDGEAFRQLVETYQTPAYRLAARMCGPDGAEDVTQEAFLAAWRGLPQFRGDCRFSTWLYRLVNNAAIDYLRREKRHRDTGDVDDLELPDGDPSPQELAEQIDTALCVDGEYVSTETCRVQKDGVTYVALTPMAKVLDPAVQITWDAAAATATLKTEKLTLTARVGQLYVQANGRYLYVPEGVQMVDGKVTVPLSVLTKAFDARLSWDGASGTVMVNRGSGAIQSGDSFYDGNGLFWLSRIIQAESGNQPLEGRIAVGNVVMNRVASPAFPNTVKEVLAQKNQFTTWKNGRLADRIINRRGDGLCPMEEAILAANTPREAYNILRGRYRTLTGYSPRTQKQE